MKDKEALQNALLAWRFTFCKILKAQGKDANTYLKHAKSRHDLIALQPAKPRIARTIAGMAHVLSPYHWPE
jgi:fermentation-respiration switch protein FrsA (DUF1100 family)